MNKLHYFADSISLLSLPEKFTYPFHYTPHPLCVAAAGEVGRYLSTKGEWQGELRKGKMFGVLCKSQMAFSESKKNRYRESTGGSRSCRQMCDIKIASNGWLTRRSLPDRFWMIYGDG